MWNGEPEILETPLPMPQYALSPRCPPQTNRTSDVHPVPTQALAVNVTSISAELSAEPSPRCVTGPMDVMVPL